MPIRTNRGRASVYRKLWGWPLRSPKHLAISAFVAALLITGAGVVIPKIVGKTGPQVGATGTTSRSAPPGQPTGQQALPTTPITTKLPTRITSPPQTPSSAAASRDALDVATRWAKAWVRPPDGTTSEQWLAGLRPLTTDEYIGVMADVDPANVPASQVTGDAVAKASFEKSVEAEVPTDRGMLLITVIKTGQGWRVDKYERGA